jgi:hypothetical protein
MSDAFETFVHKGVEINLYYDEDPINPRREYDNVGRFVWLDDYNTREYNLEDERADVSVGDLTIRCPACRGRGEFTGRRSRFGDNSPGGGYHEPRPCNVCDDGEVSTEDIVTWAKHFYDAHLVIPVEFSDGQCNGSIYETYPSGANGCVYVTKEKIEYEWGKGAAATKKAKSYLRTEIETYNSYVEGEVYGWTATLGEHAESCWGYFGELDYMRSEAVSAAEHMHKDHDPQLQLEALVD